MSRNAHRNSWRVRIVTKMNIIVNEARLLREHVRGYSVIIICLIWYLYRTCKSSRRIYNYQGLNFWVFIASKKLCRLSPTTNQKHRIQLNYIKGREKYEDWARQLNFLLEQFSIFIWKQKIYHFIITWLIIKVKINWVKCSLFCLNALWLWQSIGRIKYLTIGWRCYLYSN